MAKPDLQTVHVKPGSGELRRLDGKLGLSVALDNMIGAADDTEATASGIPLGGLYHVSGDVQVRVV